MPVSRRVPETLFMLTVADAVEVLPEQSLGPRLPPEILIHVISEVGSTRELWEDPTKVPTKPSPAQATLKTLSLVNESLRSLAQPALFNYIHLYGNVDLCHFRARKLLRMLSTREESRGWIKVLRLHWVCNRNPDTGDFEAIAPPAVGQRGLMDIVSDLFLRLTQLRIFRADCVKITQAMYLQIFRLRSLRSVTCTQQWTVDGDPMGGSESSVEDLAIEDLRIEYTRHTATGGATARLAQSPRLRKLRTVIPLFDVLLGQPHPHVFQSLTELSVMGAKTAHYLADILSACPNLTSLESYVYDPREPAQNGAAATIPRNAVPFLKKLHLPLALAQEMVRGRPVESITIQLFRGEYTEGQWSKETLAPLTLGSASVKELSFTGYDWRDDGMDIIFELFPLLETLDVHFRGWFQGVSCVFISPDTFSRTVHMSSVGYKSTS